MNSSALTALSFRDWCRGNALPNLLSGLCDVMFDFEMDNKVCRRRLEKAKVDRTGFARALTTATFRQIAQRINNHINFINTLLIKSL